MTPADSDPPPGSRTDSPPDDPLLAARALVLHDLAARGLAQPAVVSMLEKSLSERRWWLSQWPEGAAYVLGLVAQDVQDAEGAVTRFVLVRRPGPLPAPTGADRTGLFAFIRDDHPGALLALLTEFAVRGVNLSRIESRPTGGRLGQYFFSLDCDGHLADERVGEALSALRRVCADVRVLGSWARADGLRTGVARGTSDEEFRDAAAWLARLRAGG